MPLAVMLRLSWERGGDGGGDDGGATGVEAVAQGCVVGAEGEDGVGDFHGELSGGLEGSEWGGGGYLTPRPSFDELRTGSLQRFVRRGGVRSRTWGRWRGGM